MLGLLGTTWRAARGYLETLTLCIYGRNCKTTIARHHRQLQRTCFSALAKGAPATQCATMRWRERKARCRRVHIVRRRTFLRAPTVMGASSTSQSRQWRASCRMESRVTPGRMVPSSGGVISCCPLPPSCPAVPKRLRAEHKEHLVVRTMRPKGGVIGSCLLLSSSLGRCMHIAASRIALVSHWTSSIGPQASRASH